jgi:hypothetical protein
LEKFGVSFLSRFEGSQLPSSVLRSIILVDTPGILSGEKQRQNRGYDFTKVVSWFAEVRRYSYNYRREFELHFIYLSRKAICIRSLGFFPFPKKMVMIAISLSDTGRNWL